jgi:dolichol kinase
MMINTICCVLSNEMYFYCLLSRARREEKKGNERRGISCEGETCTLIFLQQINTFLLFFNFPYKCFLLKHKDLLEKEINKFKNFTEKKKKKKTRINLNHLFFFVICFSSVCVFSSSNECMYK